MLNSLSPKSSNHYFFQLRYGAILLQLLIFVTCSFYKVEFPYLMLTLTMVVQVAFQGLVAKMLTTSLYASQLLLFAQALFDLIILSLLIHLTGGASNGFISFLLVPVALAVISLPLKYSLWVAVSSIASYSLMIFDLPGDEHSHHMHASMQNHFLGMWANFIISVIVLTIAIRALQQILQKREQQLSKVRENQLRNEQLIALGAASAQVTHQLATPVSTLNMLHEELVESYPDDDAIKSMAVPLEQCRENLNYFRMLSQQSNPQGKELIDISELLEQLLTQSQLLFPDMEIVLEQAEQSAQLAADSWFISSLLNLVQNAVQASRLNNRKRISISSHIDAQSWQLKIHDSGKGFKPQQLAKLGEQTLKSEKGFGIAVYLSNANIERLGGKLKLQNHPTGGAEVTVSMECTLG